MSQYLKGHKKEAVLDLIRKYMAYRMTSEVMMMNLNDKGYDVSERTLRRYKTEIRKISGANISDIYQHEIIDNFVEDIFTIKELQREGWQEYNKAKASHEKLKALALVRNTLLDKYKLYANVPQRFRLGQALRNAHDILTDSPGEGQDSLKN